MPYSIIHYLGGIFCKFCNLGIFVLLDFCWLGRVATLLSLSCASLSLPSSSPPPVVPKCCWGAKPSVSSRAAARHVIALPPPRSVNGAPRRYRYVAVLHNKYLYILYTKYTKICKSTKTTIYGLWKLYT